MRKLSRLNPFEFRARVYMPPTTSRALDAIGLNPFEFRARVYIAQRKKRNGDKDLPGWLTTGGVVMEAEVLHLCAPG